MNESIEILKAAYNAVFDEAGQIRACGRAACIHLINVMKGFSSENVGDESTGFIEIARLQSEYHRLVS